MQFNEDLNPDDFNKDDFLPYDPEKAEKEKKKPSWDKFRYKLYAPSSISERGTEGYDKFKEEDYQGNFSSAEFAKKAGAIKTWYQVVDKYNNKVVHQNIKEYLDF